MRRHLIVPLSLLAAFAVVGCNPLGSNSPVAATRTAANSDAPPGEEYGEFYAEPQELAPIPVNDIAKSMRMNVTAMTLGKQVYLKSCASCHGDDLKGAPGAHAPDLTDAAWRFAGDDIETAGTKIYPSDVEWTVRYGIRSGHKNARGLEADMIAFDPQYRNAEDKAEFGDQRFLTDAEISDVVEYVLKLSGQEADAAKAARGDGLFHEGTKGNCYDCHEEDGTGDLPLGSTNLTRKDLFIYGSDRATIFESVTHGRHGVMPAFEGQLKPEEIKAVSVYVFARAEHER